MSQVRGNVAANAVRLFDRRSFTSMYEPGCRELKCDLTGSYYIEVLVPAGFLGLLVFSAISRGGLQNAT